MSRAKTIDPSTRPTIVPSHTCFDDCFDFFIEMLTAQQLERDRYRYRIVHAVCRGRDVTLTTGQREYGHGWVEQLVGGAHRVWCWQAGMLGEQRVWFAMRQLALYEGCQVDRACVYTLDEAYDMNLATGHLGPWDRGIYALVNRATEAKRTIFGAFEGEAPVAVVPVERAAHPKVTS